MKNNVKSWKNPFSLEIGRTFVQISCSKLNGLCSRYIFLILELFVHVVISDVRASIVAGFLFSLLYFAFLSVFPFLQKIYIFVLKRGRFRFSTAQQILLLSFYPKSIYLFNMWHILGTQGFFFSLLLAFSCSFHLIHFPIRFQLEIEFISLQVSK